MINIFWKNLKVFIPIAIYSNFFSGVLMSFLVFLGEKSSRKIDPNQQQQQSKDLAPVKDFNPNAIKPFVA